jgi:dipeptidyl-peptidase-4
MTTRTLAHPIGALLGAVTLASLLAASTAAQDRLKTVPGYEQYQQMSKELGTAVRSGALGVTWQDDGRSFEFQREGKTYRFDLRARTATETGSAAAPVAPPRPFGGVERGRQAASAVTADGKKKAFYRDRNLWVADADGSNEVPVTSDGSDEDRIKYGTASWVYGEELAQTTAMWWSPDGTRLAYYRFDEKQVPDYFLQLDQTKLYSRADIEAYPKAGQPNPVVDLFVFDTAVGKSTRIDVRDGGPFENGVVGYYVYRVRWAPDGRELLFSRTNRRQNVLELVAASPSTGACRVVVREEWSTGWVENSPTLVFLSDGRRFIWESQRNGWRNYYLYDLDGRLLAPLTTHTTFEAASLVKLDEKAGLLYYTARDGDNHLKLQLHRVGLDGTHDVRLTDPAFHHTVGGCLPREAGAPRMPMPGGGGCGVAPDNRHFVDVYQAHDTPPATRVVDDRGRVIAEVASADASKLESLGLRKAELFTYLAADGRTTLRGVISFPSHFDPSRKYPALVSVYGGPGSAGNTARETFVAPTPFAEFGFVVLNLDSRAAPGMGKRVLDSIYLKLGQTEIDDMAEGIKALWNRPWLDKSRVGIFGTSYGGYASVMALLRHPDVFHAASASSAVTAWYHYDSIYTERYMGLPEENKAGYDAGSAMTYADKLRGRLLVYYGTADNNVHPTNSMQLIQALQRAGKSFDVQVGPDAGHSGVRTERMLEFFVEALSPAR